MRERLVTLAGGALALLIMLALFGPEPSHEPTSSPTSIDSGVDGFSALRQWLEQAAIPVRSLRQPYDTLWLEGGLPESGNLLVVSLPQRHGSRPAARAELKRWVAQGNSVLLLAAMSDWPDWAERDDTATVHSLLTELDIDMESVSDERQDSEQDEDMTEPATRTPAPNEPLQERLTLRPAGDHPATAGVSEVLGEWRYSEARYWTLKGLGPRAALVLLRDGPQEAAFWEVPLGDGRILLSRHARLFGNGQLGQADNARFLSNLIALGVGARGEVIFDDYHHGLSELYDPDAFFRDPRLFHTLAFVGALWLTYLLGHTNRLHPPRRPRRGLTPVDEVRALGGLLARQVRRERVARRMFHHFFNDLRAACGRSRNGRPAWELLAEDPRVAPALIERLKKLHLAAEQGRAINLVELQDWLQRTRKMLR